MIIYENGIKREMTQAEKDALDKILPSIEQQFQQSMIELRAKRNALLIKTDWTSGSDVTMSDAMKTYRQQLRDAPSGLDTVEKVRAYEFPEEVSN
jgi:uncharacterized protein YqgV (UPF0045/DUF77 family)